MENDQSWIRLYKHKYMHSVIGNGCMGLRGLIIKLMKSFSAYEFRAIGFGIFVEIWI